MTVGYWVWFARVWFWFVYCGFFFLIYFINTSVFGLLEHLCVWFAGVCFAFVLGFDFSASDDAI